MVKGAKSNEALLNLSPTDFEFLCRALLRELGFQNLHWRRGGKDRGRDIVGEFVTVEPDGTKIFQTWFIECKHHSVANPVSVSDLQTKIAWADAEQPDYFLIITTSYLTSDAKDWIEKILPQKRYRLRYWEETYLAELLAQYPKLNQIYLQNRKTVKNKLTKEYMLKQIEQFRAWSKEGTIVLEEVLGEPPDRFIFGLKCKAVIGFDEKEEPIFGSYHRVMISVPDGYPIPRSLPNVMVLTTIVHPHVYENGLLCYGYCDPFESLTSLIMKVYSILSYENYDLNDPVREDPRLVKHLRSRKNEERSATPDGNT